MPDQFNPADIRYIKLGSGGAFVNAAHRQGIIPLAFPLADHDLCASASWRAIKEDLLKKGRSPLAAQQDIRELKDFYELPVGSLWITMADGHLWWALAGDQIDVTAPGVDDMMRWRSTQGGGNKKI